MNYNFEADIWHWNLAPKKEIKKAVRFGRLIIHLSKNNTPILIEFFGARKFFKKNVFAGNRNILNKQVITSPAFFNNYENSN